MKIVICGSMMFSKNMVDVKNELLRLGHEVEMPKFFEHYLECESMEELHSESVKHKLEHDLIRDYFNVISKGDAILILNYDKKGIKNYIGGNTFLEMGFAHCLNKKIFLLNQIPDMMYSDEIQAMQPIVINSDFSLIE